MAASMACSMAQNVYSANVVGYVNVTLPGQQFTAVANPLDGTMGGTVAGANDVSALFSSTAGNINAASTLATFNSAAADFDAPISYSGKSPSWSGNFTMAPGKGALYFNAGATPTVVTFVGQVVQGTYTVATMPAQSFTLAGSPVPLGGDVLANTKGLGLAPSAADTVATFNSAAADWNAPVSWSAKSSAWSGPMTINPGQGFLYFNASASANTWTSNFTVQ